MAKKVTPLSVASIFDGAPRIAALLKRKGTTYIGTAVVQDPGAWTSVGPCWIVPDVGYVSVAYGVARWGTSKGLQELASEPTAKPKIDALAITVSERPNRCYMVLDEALKSIHNGAIAALAASAEQYEAEIKR